MSYHADGEFTERARAHLWFDLARQRMPFSFILIVMMALILTVDGNTPIFHFKREPNISCSRTQFSITTAYRILSIRPFRALCWTSATAILHRVSWPSLDYCSRRVRYCESEERGGRAEQHVSDKYSGPRSWQSDSLQLLPQWHGYIPLPPRSFAIVHPIPAISLLLMIPHASSERPEEWRGKLFARLLRRGTIVINRHRVSVS